MGDDHQDPSEVDLGLQAELLAVADAWNAAIVANDAEAIGGFMADEWVMVSESGLTTKDGFLAFVASGDLTHSAMDRVGEPRIRVCGEVALLSTRATNTAHYQGRRYDADEWTTDVLTRRDGRWVCVLSQITPVAAVGA